MVSLCGNKSLVGSIYIYTVKVLYGKVVYNEICGYYEVPANFQFNPMLANIFL